MKSRFAALTPSLVALSVLATACSSSSTNAAPDAGADTSAADSSNADAASDGAHSIFTVPATLDALSATDGSTFFDHPWPSDFRRDADGTIHLQGTPNPRLSVLIQQYIDQLTGQIDGFSPAAAGYLAFDSDVDPTTIPADAASSMTSTSAVQLIDVDPTSPELGTRKPFITYYRSAVGTYYTRPYTLAWMPALGAPLRTKTQYAIVATTSLKSTTGLAFAPSTDLQAVLDGTSALGTAWKPALDALATDGIARTQIAHLSVFTTNDPLDELTKAATVVRELPAPVQTDIAYVSSSTTYDRYDGHYSGSPNFQQGTPPYTTAGGGFVDDPTGTPQVQQTFSLRFRIIMPKVSACPMPANGYPIVIYAHGTGGDYTSFDDDGTGGALAAQCVASTAIDQLFAGDRPGAPAAGPNQESEEDLLFFNTSNPISSRTNPRQAAIDEIMHARLITTGGLMVPASASQSGAAITFDPTRVGYFGHSQGSLNGPLMFAVDDQTRGGVLSGAGSMISYSLIYKSLPDPSVSGLFASLLDVDAGDEDEINPLHPIPGLLQTVIDVADAVHYYPHVTRDPLTGHTSKSVLMTEGVNPDGTGDSYAPPLTIEAGAIAGRFPLLNPVVHDIPNLTQLFGVADVSAPVSGNFASGRATALIAQFVPPPGDDGHFVVFDVPAAQLLAAKFCRSVLTDSPPIAGGP